jgi:HD superfamily phosphohydrolase
LKRIYDPIHHFIELSEAEAALLDVGPMQRLRRLRQLGLAYVAFPAAEHSRFTHALGALAAGDRALEGLRRHDPDAFADERDYHEQRRLLRASLLVHDIGHGPFSHACEAVLGVAHERRTREILALAPVRAALERLDVDPAEVLSLVAGEGAVRSAVLRELVSGPNLDADRMDYLLRDAYFTGVVSGRYDVEQLIGSLRTVARDEGRVLGIDGRGTVALESFVLARYMMFATVYFHHTTRMFERVLQDALREIWPNPRALDPIEEFLAWDDFRVLDALRDAPGEAAAAMRERRRPFAVVAEFNAARDQGAYEACLAALRERWGAAAVWADEQEQLLHRLPFGAGPTVYIVTRSGPADARDVSDLIARLSGKAYWRKIFVRRDGADVAAARAICALHGAKHASPGNF